jgi:alkanesulfonate monooxygenase SsuD/methylene tetrahydromethanopterin reductase-like flavin-dependent oxidoreductase (luciferase family)
MWAATGDPRTAAEVGRRGMVHTLVLRGHEGTRRAYAAYRNARAEAGLPPVSTDNFAYSAFVHVGDTDEEGMRVGEKLLWFLHTSLKSAPQYAQLLPGTAPPEVAGQAWRTRPKAAPAGPTTWLFHSPSVPFTKSPSHRTLVLEQHLGEGCSSERPMAL